MPTELGTRRGLLGEAPLALELIDSVVRKRPREKGLMERAVSPRALLTPDGARAERVRRYYGRWAATYGSEADDGLFARIRGREKRIVAEMLRLTGGESVLDVGCGSGVHCVPIAERGHEVWAVDVAAEMTARVASHVAHASTGDVCTLELGRVFDRILCLGVLEFVSDPALAFARLRRHLAPQGSLVVLVPHFDRSTHTSVFSLRT